MHVEREAGHIEEVENRFYTGNRVFDEIVGLSLRNGGPSPRRDDA
jgi:hypothetical protein